MCCRHRESELSNVVRLEPKEPPDPPSGLGLEASAEGIDVPHHEALKAALDKADVQYEFVSCPGVHDMGTALGMWPKVLAYHAEVFRKAATQPRSQ